MATSVARDAKHDDWAETRPTRRGDPPLTRAQLLLWTLFGLALLSASLFFVIHDTPFGT